MKLDFNEFVHWCFAMGEATFHWGLWVQVDSRVPAFEYIIVDSKTGEVMHSDTYEGTYETCVAQIISRLYHCAIATKNGGKFNYNPGVMHFIDWVAEMFSPERQDDWQVLPPPDQLWQEYRMEMMGRYRTKGTS